MFLSLYSIIRILFILESVPKGSWLIISLMSLLISIILLSYLKILKMILNLITLQSLKTMSLIRNRNFQIALLVMFFTIFKIDFRFEDGIFAVETIMTTTHMQKQFPKILTLTTQIN